MSLTAKQSKKTGKGQRRSRASLGCGSTWISELRRSSTARLRDLRLRLSPLLCCLVVCTAPAGSALAAERTSVAHDLLFLAGKHPLVLRVHTVIDGGSIADLRRYYADYLFRGLDADGDGALNEAEARGALALHKSTDGKALLGDRWTDLDHSPQDGVISADEFFQHFDAGVGAAFVVTQLPLRDAQSVPLFRRLDQSGDGALSVDELANAFATLHKLDLDDDETFSVEELQPYPEPIAPNPADQPAGSARALPFVPLSDAAAIDTTAAELVQRFDQGAPGARDGLLTADELGLESAALARFDADGDGRLNVAEVAALLRDPLPFVEIEVQLPKRRRGTPAVGVIGSAAAAGSAASSLAKDLQLDLSGLGVQLQPLGTRVATSDAVNFYKAEMLRVDSDKNRYLDENEFRGLGLPGAAFAAVDSNGDGQIYPDEVAAYVQQDAILSQSQIVVSVGREGTTLFEIIDQNLDRRLTRRELQQAADRMREHDVNGDGRLAEYELDSHYQITIEVGKPPLFQSQAVPNRNLARATTALSATAQGPLWFRKMDSNRDGDVSWREFLGPREVFDRLDADQNQLIDATEANAAQPQ